MTTEPNTEAAAARATLRLAIKTVAASWGAGWRNIGDDLRRSEVARELLTHIYVEPHRARALAEAFICVGGEMTEDYTRKQEEDGDDVDLAEAAG